MVFSEAFLHVVRRNLRDCVAVVFIERNLDLEASKRQSNVDKVVLLRTETSL